jgi:hypothetical protein
MLVSIIIIIHFAVLIGIPIITSKEADTNTFSTANRQSPWCRVINGVLMPLCYRLNLVSIYSYLNKQFGFQSYKTGAFFFLVSRTIGSSRRLYPAASGSRREIKPHFFQKHHYKTSH